jgi:putative membrane protein
MKNSLQLHSNRDESPSFLRGALMWRGSVTPRILPSLLLMTCYCLVIVALDQYWRPLPHLAVTPFEYTGVVLGLVLVFRTNTGHERWWEARKLWGGIVNQSRNLVIAALNYGEVLNNPQESQWRKEIVKWTVAFSFAARESLRNGKNFDDLSDLLDEQELEALKSAGHMPLFVAGKIASLLQQARSSNHIDGFVFEKLEGQRILLIDYMGGCERILKTPMPLVYAIKARRFILIFLLLLPFSLIENLGFSAVFIYFLVAYPLLSLDRIGIELQNPFATQNLSHLPLHTICDSIKLHCLAMLEQSQQH